MSKGRAARSVAEFKSTFSPEADVIFLRQRVAELEAKHEHARQTTGEVLEIVHELRNAITEAGPVKMAYEPSEKGSAPCTHVLHLSDWHYGAVTKKDEVDGFGEYNSQIAEKRLLTLGQAIIKKTLAQRHGYVVPRLHILGTADYISGGIHYELDVTNEFPCPVQAVRCGYAMGGLLMMFAPHFETIVVDLVTLDNHGRLTRKPQSSEGGFNNWGYVVAEIAKQYVSKQQNITVNIHAKPSALVTVGPERYLCFHGHQVKAWAGIPYYGLDRRVAMEAVKRMGLPEQEFTKMVSGHLHVAFNSIMWNLGGSLSGTDAFDHNCGRHSKPHQTSWFVHPRHGEFDWTRWRV
jgi:hypothetical protein